MWQHSPNITPRWANMAPTIAPRWANIDAQVAFLQCPSQAEARFRRKNASQGPRWPLGRAFLESILQHDPKTVPLFRPSGSVSWNLYKILVLFLAPAWPVLGAAHTIAEATIQATTSLTTLRRMCIRRDVKITSPPFFSPFLFSKALLSN